MLLVSTGVGRNARDLRVLKSQTIARLRQVEARTLRAIGRKVTTKHHIQSNHIDHLDAARSRFVFQPSAKAIKQYLIGAVASLICNMPMAIG
jgi:hypothetical protein